MKRKGLPRATRNTRCKLKSRGYTLIEILVVIVIMLIMTTIGVMALASAKKSRQVSVAADKLKGIILETRSYAITKPASLGIASQIKIQINKTTNAITFFKDPTLNAGLRCRNSGWGDIIPPLVSDTYIPKNIKFGRDYYICYDAKNSSSLGNTYIGPTNQITLTDGTVSYQLTITPYGGININKL